LQWYIVEPCSCFVDGSAFAWADLMPTPPSASATGQDGEWIQTRPAEVGADSSTAALRKPSRRKKAAAAPAGDDADAPKGESPNPPEDAVGDAAPVAASSSMVATQPPTEVQPTLASTEASASIAPARKASRRKLVSKPEETISDEATPLGAGPSPSAHVQPPGEPQPELTSTETSVAVAPARKASRRKSLPKPETAAPHPVATSSEDPAAAALHPAVPPEDFPSANAEASAPAPQKAPRRKPRRSSLQKAKAADNDGGEATNASVVSNLTVSETETQYQDDFEADASPAKQASSSNLQRVPSQSLGASKPEQAEQLSHSNDFPSPARRDAVAETPEAAAKPGVPLSLQSPPPARQPPVVPGDSSIDDKVDDTATAVATTQGVDVEPDATLPAAGDVTVISPEKKKERDEAAAAAKAIVCGRLAKPRVQSKTKAQVDEEKRLEAEREAAKLQRRLLKLKTEGPPERIRELGEPRVAKVDPRAGRPPPEIEEAQRLANLRFKETVKRRQREFDLVLEQEQHRLFHRFQEYAASKGTVLEETATTEPAAEPHASSHNDHDADAADVVDEAEIDAIVLALTTGHLTNMLPPGREAPPPPPVVPDRDSTLTKHRKKKTKKGRASSSVEPTLSPDATTSPHTADAESPSSPKSTAAGAASPLASSPTSPGGDGNDDGVSIAGHISHNPTSTTRHTFRPASWKQHLSPEVREELFPTMVEKTPSPSAQLPSLRQQGTIQRAQQPQQKAHASTPTPSRHVPLAGSSGSRPGGTVSNATPEPVTRATATHGTTGSTQIKRTACVGAGGLTVIDGAVSDFLLGDGEVKRTRVPTLYRRKVQLQGHSLAHR
jgi:hypothetical protein